jgi:ABC-type sugar transport system ATPase subunit
MTDAGTSTAVAAQPLLALTNINKTFGGVRALDNVSISVRAGEVVGLVGDNGAGKSTLVKVMAGTLNPDSGEFLFDGRPVNLRSPADATALGIQTVYQDLALCDNLDAVKNLFLGRELEGSFLTGGRVRRAESERRAREVLMKLRLDKLSLTRPVGRMSGGQRQNIAIARAILWNPRLILLDEPTAALSLSASLKVGELIRTLADQGHGVLVVSHDIHNFVMTVTDRIEVLRLGKNAASYVSKEANAEQVVNSMVGGQEGVNSSR